ncbi:MAG TPA: glycoside hydrolase family 3 N-terminal domain-containing protein, partial [Balneolaceae bacterium]|nr:glycoside hydrolase family 3 N-terminal domain-containing protein [Balneolaceae bacterium]
MLSSKIPKALVLLGLILGLFAAKNLKAQSYPFKKKDSIYKNGWIDLNKNGQMDPYENPQLSIDKRVDDLISRMTVEEKTAQMVTIYGYGAVLKDEQPTKSWLKEPWKNGMGNMDEQLNGRKESDLLWPPANHDESMNNIQRFFIEQTRLGIPVDFTNEGIHGLKARKATSFPVEIGMGSTWDPGLENQIAHVEGTEAKALGYTNIYSPVLGLSRDPRWGRTVETFGEDPYLVSTMGVEMVKGLQDEGVASTLK